MVQIFAFLYSPESATIIQEPLQFVIQKEINIKFLANLDRSAENLQQFLSQERDLEILSALSEIFAQNFDDKDRSKFYDFIFSNGHFTKSCWRPNCRYCYKFFAFK